MSRNLQAPADLQEFTSLSSLNLHAVKNRPAILLRAVAGSGSLEVIMAGSGGVARTITLAEGEHEIGEFMTVVSATGITKIRAGWN